MSWRVFVRAAAETDLESLDAADQEAVAEQLFSWVEVGPPRQTPREVFGAHMFDDDLAGGFRVTYVVDDQENNILIIRVRKTSSSP